MRIDPLPCAPHEIIINEAEVINRVELDLAQGRGVGHVELWEYAGCAGGRGERRGGRSYLTCVRCVRAFAGWVGVAGLFSVSRLLFVLLQKQSLLK